MLSLLQRIIFLLVILEEPTFSDSSKIEDTGRVLKSIQDIYNEFLIYFEPGNDFMDIFVNTECLNDNTVLFKAFLYPRAKPVTLWTDGLMHSRHCQTRYPTQLGSRFFFQMVYFICGNYEVVPLLLSLGKEYFMKFFVVAENANHGSEEYRKAISLQFEPPYPRASGTYVINYENGSRFITSEFQRKLIERQSLRRGLLERQRTLNGSMLQLTCASTYACQPPSFNVTLKLLMHRNASVYVDPSVNNRRWVSSINIKSLNNPADRNNDGAFGALHYFGSAGFSFYVLKRNPVLKETIFFLPFVWEIWVGLLVSCLLLVLAYGLIEKVKLKPNVNIFIFLFPMVAALFQQSTQLHTRLLNTSPSRMLYGIMTLMFVVISTAFKGRLTSLLNNLPLEGEATQFVLFEHLVQTGHRLCFLESLGLILPFRSLETLKENAKIRGGKSSYQTSNLALRSLCSIKISADGKDTFFYNLRTGRSEVLRRELLRRGYIEREGTVFSYPVGPEIKPSSVYRNAFGTTVSQAIEAGLYQRYASLAEYKSRYFNDASLEHVDKLVLNFGDLRPFFLAWFLGGFFSILVFIGEEILSRVGCRKRSHLGKVIPKRPPQNLTRTTRLT